MAGIPRRPFGNTGEELSILGLGGGHIGGDHLTPDEAVRLMHQAIDEGINFFDNAWEYSEGESEVRMGQAIADRRDSVFLMTKVCARDAQGATAQLDESLSRLRTDHLDLWQFHEVNYGNDPDLIFAPGGAAEAGLRARDAGKVRFLGFTGHKDPTFLLKMLEHEYPWSALLMPVNILDPSYHRSFIREVLPEAERRGIAVLGMKSLGGCGQIVSEGGVDVETCLRYALSQSIASLVSGIDSPEVLAQNVRIAREFTPMDSNEEAAAVADARNLAVDGHLEWFKTTQYFDSRVHRDQHGFPEVRSIN